MYRFKEQNHIVYKVLKDPALISLQDTPGFQVSLIMLLIGLKPFSTGTVFIRLNLTYKNGPRTERNKIFLMVVHP